MARTRQPTEKQAADLARVRAARRRRRRLVVLLVLVVAGAAACIATGPVRALVKGSSTDGEALDPSAFSPGACVAYPPTSGDRHLTVFLDAGHGGLDPGAVGETSSGATIDEATETLPVELDAARLLRAAGYRVVVSRTTDSNVVRLTAPEVDGTELSLQGAHDDVAARARCADLADADLLVGIYFDSGASAQDGGSVTTYDTVRPFSADNLRFADLLQADVLGAMNAQGWQIPDNGVQPDSQEGSIVPTSSESAIAIDAAEYGHVLLLGPAMAGFFTTPSQMPGALIEPLFVTDPFEGSLAASPSAQQVIAQGIARAVDQYFAPQKAAG